MSAALAVAAMALLTQSAMAGNPFSKSTSTEGGNETWDSDQIDIENVSQTGAGVYVAVLDTGLVANWKDYFPDARVAQELGTGFEQNVDMTLAKNGCELTLDPTGPVRQTTFVGSRTSSHGTHTSSTIIGYNYYSNTDAVQGFPLPAIQVRGIAPNATLIPVKVLADYQIPARHQCTEIPAAERAAQAINFGTDGMVAAGIDYVTSLAQGKLAGSRIVINMSLGDTVKANVIEDAIDRAIAAGDASRIGSEPLNLFWFAHHLVLMAALTRLPAIPCLSYGNADDLERQLCQFILRGIGLNEAAITSHLDRALSSIPAPSVAAESA